MTPTEKWIRKELNIADNTVVGDITLPIGLLATMLDGFCEHKQMEGTCPKCGIGPMIKTNNEYKCEMCQVK